MFSKQIVLWSAAIVVAVLVAGSAVASAQRGERRRGFGPHGPFLTFGVELTAEQREQIRAIVAEERQQQPATDTVGSLNRQLDLELLAEAPDQARLDGLQAQIVEAQQTALQKRIELRKRIAQVLTPEQRAKAREWAASGPRRPARGQDRR